MGRDAGRSMVQGLNSWFVITLATGVIAAIACLIAAKGVSAGIFGDCEGILDPTSPPAAPGPVTWCRKNYNYVPGNKPLRVQSIDGLDAGTWSGYLPNVTYAWSQKVGPQNFKAFHRDNDTNDEFIDLTNTQMDALCPGCDGFTVNCPVSGSCSNVIGGPDQTYYSYAYYALARTSGWTGLQKKWLISHELGHTLGLAHHPCTCAVMYNGPSSPLGFFQPSSKEVGMYPSPCSGNWNNWGLLCIYKYTSGLPGGGEEP